RTTVKADALPALMCHIIERIDALCAEKGVGFRAMLHEHLHGARVSPEMKADFLAVCRGRGLPVTEITTQIRKDVPDYRELIAADDCHWSRKGNERVAEIIRRALAERVVTR